MARGKVAFGLSSTFARLPSHRAGDSRKIGTANSALDARFAGWEVDHERSASLCGGRGKLAEWNPPAPIEDAELPVELRQRISRLDRTDVTSRHGDSVSRVVDLHHESTKRGDTDGDRARRRTSRSRNVHEFRVTNGDGIESHRRTIVTEVVSRRSKPRADHEPDIGADDRCHR